MEHSLYPNYASPGRENSQRRRRTRRPQTPIKTWLIHFTEKLRASAWTTPTIYLLLAVALANYTLWLDRKFMGILFEHKEFLKLTTVADSRALVSTIATSMLAIAGVSFSSIMVTMTLASQQFGPRLLRNFIKDAASQRTLGVLMGTFVYCLFILRGIHTSNEQSFVPQLSTLVAMILAILCLGFFIGFIQHILNEIEAERVIVNTFEGLQKTIEAVFPSGGKVENRQTTHPSLDYHSGSEILAGKTGYIQAISYQELVELAEKHDVLLTIEHAAGDFLSEHQVLARLISETDQKDLDEEVVTSVQGALLLGRVRTPEQDYQYGFRQLVEVALRALSPGTNDPFTAMDCIDYLGAALQNTFKRPLPPSAHYDESGKLRVYSKPNDYRSLVGAAVDQIRRDSRTRCDVSCRLLDMLAATAVTSRFPEQQSALLEQAILIHQDTLEEMSNEHDIGEISTRFETVRKACHLIEPDAP